MGYTFLALQSDGALLARAMADELAAARAS
jgi:hypothetical protein